MDGGFEWGLGVLGGANRERDLGSAIALRLRRLVRGAFELCVLG